MTDRASLEQVIAALEAQCAVLGDAVVDAMIAAVCELRFTALPTQPGGPSV